MKELPYSQGACSQGMPAIHIAAIILLVAAVTDFVASFQITTRSTRHKSYNKMRWTSTAKAAMHSSSEEETHATKRQLSNFSPVPWLRQEAWAAMPRYEKENFMNHCTEGNFQSDRQQVRESD